MASEEGGDRRRAEQLKTLLPLALESLDFRRLEHEHGVRGELVRGKVRDILHLDGNLLIVTTDRISAFDRVLTTIPCKGEVLNRISLFWFHKTADIISNHVVNEISSRTVLVHRCELVPLEVVVRGHLTGSAWRDYQAGKPVSGISLQPGLRINHRFERPLLTPSTKEIGGEHDRPISRDEILSERIVPEPLWNRIEETALELFDRGREVARKQGLILVDTKYEFGLLGDELLLIDEIHTPDSSRYWYADTYEELFEKGENQRELDKEYLRRWLMEHGFQGEGDPPHIPDKIRIEVALRYIRTFEIITGEEFVPAALPADEEINLIAQRVGS